MSNHLNIAVIPARGGSKRIPNKNIKIFCGKPIIYWPIKIAKESGLFDRIIISTDDEKISELAISFGAEVPFIRPNTLSDDFTPISDVIVHSINSIKIEEDSHIDSVCCILPTAALLRAKDLIQGYQIFKKDHFSFVFSATDFSYPIQRSFKKNSFGGLTMFYPEFYSSRSQDLEKAYHDAGLFYFGKVDAWVKKKKIFSNDSSVVIIPRSIVQDIDDLEDWIIAEQKFKNMKHIE